MKNDINNTSNKKQIDFSGNTATNDIKYDKKDESNRNKKKTTVTDNAEIAQKNIKHLS